MTSQMLNSNMCRINFTTDELVRHNLSLNSFPNKMEGQDCMPFVNLSLSIPAPIDYDIIISKHVTKFADGQSQLM